MIPSELTIDRKKLMGSLGINLETREFIDLSSMGVEELYDLMMKSLMWMEHISEILSRAKKIKLDKELESDLALSESMSKVSSASKVAGMKAEAKLNPEYVNAKREYNKIAVYVDYLERLLVNLDRFHYVIKSRIDHSKNIERKY